MPNYTTPGVYIEEIPKLPLSVAQVATAIPAFIGYTEFAKNLNGEDLKNKPTRITSLLEYQIYFGSAQPEANLKVSYAETQNADKVTTGETITVEIAGDASPHNMYYALQAYFANDGGPCYIVSIGAFKAFTPAGGGGGGDTAGSLVLKDFTDGLDAIAKEDEPTLLVFPEAQKLVTAASETDFDDLMVAALNQCAKLQDRFTIMDFANDGSKLVATNLNTVADTFRGGVAPTNPVNLKYGAAYFPNLKSNLPFRYADDKVAVARSLNGVAAAPQTLEVVNEGAPAAGGNPKIDPNVALFNKLKKAVDSFPVVLPPSPFVAGVYCSVDAARGVWKAPANVPLAKVIAPTFKVTDEQQGNLNVNPLTGKSINCIRAFTGRGTLVWGARTLAGNDNEWRYINVRRFFIMVEESCKLATQPFVFEPNDSGTWVKIQGMIENFLTTLWRQGALQGAKPEHAFYVSLGLGKTMSALDILEGRLIIEIGLAVVRPAEFIIMRFMHKLPES